MVPTLTAMIGPPGAGKSTWIQRMGLTTVVSLDAMRAAVSWCGCAMNQTVTQAAVELATATARTALAAGGHVTWDATNAERASRMHLQVLAAEYGARTTAVVLLPDLQTVLALNGTRDPRPCLCGYPRQVPAEIVRRMREQIVADLPTLLDEGWDAVVWPPNPDRENHHVQF